MHDIAPLKRALQLLRMLEKELSTGPQSLHLENLLASYDLLMERFCPHKVGDQVRLVIAPVIEETYNWGWLPYKDKLVLGATGTVVRAACGAGGFSFLVWFDRVEDHFCFSEPYLAPLTGGKE